MNAGSSDVKEVADEQRRRGLGKSPLASLL